MLTARETRPRVRRPRAAEARLRGTFVSVSLCRRIPAESLGTKAHDGERIWLRVGGDNEILAVTAAAN